MDKVRLRIIDNSVSIESIDSALRNARRYFLKLVWYWRPIEFSPRRKVRHRMRFDSDACDAELLALNDRRSGSAERIEQGSAGTQIESADVLANKMRREREHKTVPIVSCAVVWFEPIRVGS